MVPKGDGGSACVDENGVLDFVQGRLSQVEVARVDEHADGCLACRMAIEEAVRTFRERATGVERSAVPVATRFAAGDHLAGRYRIVRFIARGGMGEVYEAEDEMLGTRIAVKTVAAAISDNPHVAHRLKQEVNLARRITHPNVCRIFDLGVHAGAERVGSGASGVLFLTMELIAGVSLAQRVREQGRFSSEAALPVAKAMAAAVGAAHAAGVVHRDFKSENVMLAEGATGGQRVVVMDFGLARGTWLSTHDSIEGRGLAGTLAYMAPEQLHGQRVGPAADIYALGVVLFEMLTGQLPFVPPDGEAGIAWALWRLSEPAPEVRSLVPDVDPRWNDLVARCLERDVERRPPSADDILWALDVPSTLLARAAGTPVPPSPSDSGVRSGGAPGTTAATVPPAAGAPAPPDASAWRSRQVWLRGGLVMGGLAAVGALVALRAASPGPTHASAAPRRTQASPPAPPPRPPEQPKQAAGAPSQVAPGAGPPTQVAAPPPTQVARRGVPPRTQVDPGAAPPPTQVAPADRPRAAEQRVSAARPAGRPVRRDRAAGGPVHPEIGREGAGAAPTREPAPAEPRPRSADPEDGFIFK